MSLLLLRVLGDPILRGTTTDVTEITEDVLSLIADMKETMQAASGIGLAAPQVGRSERVAVIGIDETQKLVLINPRVVERAGSATDEEGCLSIPGLRGQVERPAEVTVEALDENGVLQTIKAHDLLARCLQHEIDHLDGRLFIDYLGLYEKKRLLGEWKKRKDKYPGNSYVVKPAKTAAERSRFSLRK